MPPSQAFQLSQADDSRRLAYSVPEFRKKTSKPAFFNDFSRSPPPVSTFPDISPRVEMGDIKPIQTALTAKPYTSPNLT
jgi:hypothetical protein